MAVLKRLAARTQPWRTPEEMENASEIVPFTLTTLWVDEYRVLMMSTSFEGDVLVMLMYLRIPGFTMNKCMILLHCPTNVAV